MDQCNCKQSLWKLGRDAVVVATRSAQPGQVCQAAASLISVQHLWLVWVNSQAKITKPASLEKLGPLPATSDKKTASQGLVSACFALTIISRTWIQKRDTLETFYC